MPVYVKFNTMSKGCLFGLSLVLFIGIHVSSAALNESTVCVKLETFNLLKSCYKNCGKLQCAFHEYCDDGRCLYCSDEKCQSPPKGCELFCSKRKADTCKSLSPLFLSLSLSLSLSLMCHSKVYGNFFLSK